jgi:3'(2'), 5'-bisphosphate nucleotidase
VKIDPTYPKELALALQAASAAAKIIASVGPEDVVAKEDGSPVTAADLRANHAIVQLISDHFPDDGLLSEETVDTDRRLSRQRVWIIDPLDGTRDFVQRTGQYAVHVALAVNGRATVGVVAEPAAHRVSWAVRGQGAFMQEKGGPIVRLAVARDANLAAFRVGTTRLAMSQNVQSFIDAEPKLQRVPMGASTKVMALARGELHAAVWLSAAEKEWDTCAPEVIVEEAGGLVTDVTGKPFVYNKTDVVHHNGIVATNGTAHDSLLQRARRFFP